MDRYKKSNYLGIAFLPINTYIKWIIKIIQATISFRIQILIMLQGSRHFISRNIKFPEFVNPKNLSNVSTKFIETQGQIPTRKIQKTGQIVSRLGFGGYRVNKGDERHSKALLNAFERGINVIDTSTHFEGGESEILIGEALKMARDRGMVERNVGG